MRISDWSSDVCSSDLLYGSGGSLRLCFAVGHHPGHCLAVELHHIERNQRLVVNDRAGIVFTGDVSSGKYQMHARHGACGGAVDDEDARIDRKRVVEGKSGSVRCVLGGRRILKKKK